MTAPPHVLNWQFGWGLALSAFVTGALLGLCFHREDFLGGYDSFRRRLLRLGHIAQAALGMMNVLYGLSPWPYPGSQEAEVAACQHWGLHTRYVGKVGDDGAAAIHRREFERLGVETYLITAAGCTSQQAVILVDDAGERDGGEEGGSPAVPDEQPPRAPVAAAAATAASPACSARRAGPVRTGGRSMGPPVRAARGGRLDGGGGEP